MYQRILVPLDGSARAERILPYVEAIAHKFGARLVLAQIVEPGATAVFEAAWVKYVEEMQQLAHDAIRYLDKIQHMVRSLALCSPLPSANRWI
jgi:nucleotide-binding universal stress UspA family protein